jgi:hypothetical protein
MGNWKASAPNPPSPIIATYSAGGTGSALLPHLAGVRTRPFLLHQVALAEGPRDAAIMRGSGEMDERFKSHAWKACIGSNLSGVRIPFSPPKMNDKPLNPKGFNGFLSFMATKMKSPN